MWAVLSCELPQHQYVKGEKAHAWNIKEAAAAAAAALPNCWCPGWQESAETAHSPKMLHIAITEILTLKLLQWKPQPGTGDSRAQGCRAPGKNEEKRRKHIYSSCVVMPPNPYITEKEAQDVAYSQHPTPFPQVMREQVIWTYRHFDPPANTN